MWRPVALAISLGMVRVWFAAALYVMFFGVNVLAADAATPQNRAVSLA